MAKKTLKQIAADLKKKNAPPPPPIPPPAPPAAAAAGDELAGRAARAVGFFDARLDEASALRKMVDEDPARAEALYELVLLAQGHYQHDKQAD